mgnify:CR=1 FL=1
MVGDVIVQIAPRGPNPGLLLVLLRQIDSETRVPGVPEPEEHREFPRAAREDYDALLTLRTAGYGYFSGRLTAKPGSASGSPV